ncbi:MAG: histidine kinase [Pseudonocardiales bacterium]|nr:histidine kinase [Pseudonocardiales bacterium]
MGKTLAMLEEDCRRSLRGADVVVGLVETRGRSHTEQAIGLLTVVPRRVVSYRGAALTDMDLDAVLARRRDIALVDELAHTNAPG